jgi:hypothetical protein
LPYLLSGGLAGLALVVVGAALFITDAMRTDREILVGHLLDLAQKLSEPPQAIGARNTINVGLVGHAGKYHRASCPTVRGLASVPSITLETALDEHLLRCRVCRPDGFVEGIGRDTLPKEGRGVVRMDSKKVRAARSTGAPGS